MLRVMCQSRRLILAPSLVPLVMLAQPAASQEAEPFEPTIHWAYASFFGTGWYKINDQRSGFIMRAPFRWTFGEAGIDEDGNRQIAYTVRLPFTLGLAQLDFEDIPGILDPDNLATASANISFDADIPITKHFHIRPVAEVGYSTIIDQSDWAWTYRAEIKARRTFEAGKLDWALLFDYGIVGYEPNRGESDQFEFDSVANYWQIGVSLGRRDKPVNIWRLNFDRLGIAYNYSTTGDLRGIKFVFRSLYDL